MLSTGTVIGHYTLMNQLNELHPSWKAHGTDGQDYVLRILPSGRNWNGSQWMTGYDGALRMFQSQADLENYLRQHPGQDVEHLMALPAIHGLAPILGYEIITHDDTVLFVIKRRFYPERMTDRFPANAVLAPEKSLLSMFASLATALDALHEHLPKLDFDLAPGDLLLEGDTPIIADYGLSQYNNAKDLNNRMWSSRVEHEGKRSLIGLYPHTGYYKKIGPLFALAALYVYMRSRFMIFEDTVTSHPVEKHPTQRMMWLEMISNNFKHYENTGSLPLPMLPNVDERAIVRKAIAHEPGEHYESCKLFVEALRAIT